jgi:6-phosphogluconolactonase (cycloisomerase 2 family)
MSTAAVRFFSLSVILSSLLAVLALGGCGYNGTKVCPYAGCCGPAGDACPVPQYLYANGLNGQINAFPINGGSGALGVPTSTPGSSVSLGMAAINNQFLYVSNPSLGGISTIDGWSINLGTGALTAVPGSPFSLGPLSLATGLAANGPAQVLYVADSGKIDALKADANGTLTTVIGSPFPAGTNLFLTIDPQNRFVFASDDTPPGNILAYTIDAGTGALTTVAGSPFSTIPGYVGNTQPGQIVVDSTGSFVYVGLLNTGQIAAFSIAPSTGVLTPIPGSPFAEGNSPITLATINNFLYVANSVDGTIAGYSINPSNGVLTPLANSPFAIHGGPLAITPFGAYLYTAGSGGLLAFRIDPQTGALTQIGSPIPYSGATVLTFVQ